MSRKDEYQVAYRKWKLFSWELRKHLKMKQFDFTGQLYISFTKHFTQRVIERTYPEERSNVRRMLYHIINTRMCELLYWHYSEDLREIVVQKGDLCIMLNRGRDGVSLVVRTFYKRDRLHCEEKYYVLNI